MKKIVISLYLVLLTLSIFSQETTKGLIGIAIGPSFPMSGYASTDMDHDNPGYAMTGLHLNLNSNYKLYKNLGVTALCTGNSHPVDVDEIVDAFRALDPSVDCKVEADPWLCSSLLGGLLFSFPFDQVNLNIRALIGCSFSTISKLNATISDSIGSMYIVRN